MTGLIRLREEVHSIVLNSRTIENIISSAKFERLWGDSTQEEKDEAHEYATQNNREGLRKWIRDHKSLDLTERPLTELRKVARRLGVKYYSQLSHAELISAIANKENK